MSIIIDNDEIFAVYIPQLIVTDDAVVFPFRNVNSSDIATLGELIQITPSAQYDSAYADEKIILSASFDLQDNSSVTDSFVSLEISPEIDSANISEFILPTFIDGPSDSVAFSDFISISTEASDFVIFEENTALAIEASDSATLSENVENISVVGPFDSSLTEEFVELSNNVYSLDIVESQYEEIAGFATLDPPDKDYYVIYDLPHVEASVPALEDPATFAEDGLLIEFSGAESLSVSDLTIDIALDGVALTDYAELFENLSINASVFTTDIINVSENRLVEAEFSSSDIASLAEKLQLNVNLSLTEIIELSENANIGPTVHDRATLTESVSIAISSVDSLNLIENKAISAVASDIAILNELNRINASASGKDSAVVSEQKPFITLFGVQNASLIETPFYHADYQRLDYLFLIKEDAFASILKEDFEFFSVTESIPNIAPNGFELITFKEKRAIGVAAPIVLNINDNPTIHGTVTGDAIIISVGGTEPVLL